MSWINRRTNKVPARKAPQKARLELEQLEDRLVLSTLPYATAANVSQLIQDINYANQNTGTAFTINLTATTYDFTSADNSTFGPNALPVITGNVTINGNGAVLMRDPSLGQNTPFRFFTVSGSQVASPSGAQSTGSPTGTLVLNNVTLEDGLAQGGSSGTGGGGLGAGGAILNMGNLTLSGVTLEQNTAQGGSSGTGSSTSGGGLGDSSATTTGNFGVGGAGASSGNGAVGGIGGGGGAGGSGVAGGWGAGSSNGSIGGGGLGAGGAIFNMYGTTTLINCTLASNLAEGGQGANNGAGFGGAVFNLDGTLNLTTSTLAYNSTSSTSNGGAAVYNLALGTTSAGAGVPSTVTLTDSILADSIGSNDLVNDENSSTNGSAVINATAPNIVTTSSTINGAAAINGSPSGANPQLGLLGNYGGQTPTIPLLSGSPAQGAGATASGVPTTDQRGVARGSVLDLGAFQSTPASAVATTVSVTSTTPATTTGSSVTLTATVTQASGGTTPSGSVQFVDTTTGATLGSATLSNGQATLTTSAVSSGDKITAVYSSSNSMGNSSGSTAVPAASTSGSTGSTGGSGSTTSPPPVAVSAQNQAWLEAVYKTLLHRDVDTQGLNEWGAALNSGSTATQIVMDIEQTTEYETDQVQAAFQQYLGVAAPSSAVSYLVGLMQAGVDYRVVQSIVIGSTAFYAANGNSPQGFLNAVYQDLLNRPPDQTSLTSYSNLIAAGFPLSEVVLGILSSPEYLNDLVTNDYMTYMGVQPDQNSLGAYVAAMQNGTMNENMLVASLLGSGEWITLHSSSNSSSTSG